MSGKDVDKQIELGRYDLRAIQILSQDYLELPPTDLSYLPLYLRTPYIFFENLLRKKLRHGARVLEVGAGTGQHTGVLVESGACVTATDISDNSLKLLQKRIKCHLHIEVSVKRADMEKLPFKDNTFDYVVSAGSLSYGDNDIVRDEIYRVLKMGGHFICVDSLNHNPIYALNRWIHFLRRSRTKSTLQRMPKISLINNYEKKFGSCAVEFFGSIVWASPLLKMFGDRFASKVIDGFDKIFKIKKSAFKFVMCVKKVK